MPIADPLKYDIRVRDRLLRKGQLEDAEIKKHLDALVDQTDRLVELELKQPALQKESERAEYAPRISRPSPTIARPAPIRPFDEEGDDDLPVPSDLDDDDDDLDDEDDEDDEDDDEAEDKAAKPAAAAQPEEKAEEKAEEKPAAEKSDDEDDWGSEP